MNRAIRFLSPWFICLAMASATLAEPPRSSDSWPRFLNTNFDGSFEISADELDTLESLDWSAPPQCVWSVKVGDGYGLGVVQDGAYFHFDAKDGMERLSKFDIKNGQPQWRQSSVLLYSDMYGYEVGPRCSPTIDGGQVFTLGVSGDLIARNLIDGEQQWKVETNAVYGVVQNFFGVGSSPLVINDTVIAMVGGSPTNDQSIAPGRLDRVSPNGSLLVGFDRQTGKERWRCGDDLASYSSPRTVSIDGVQYVLIMARDHLHVIDPREGKSIGRIKHRADTLESVNAMVPVVQGNRCLISDCYDRGSAVYDISITVNPDGTNAQFETVWKDPEGRRREQAMRSHLSTPILYRGNLYACSGRNAPDSDFRCIDFDTGKVAWSALPRQRSTASRLGNLLLIQKERGDLHIARCVPESYQELAFWNLSEPEETASIKRPAIRFPCWSAPVIAGDVILVRGDDHVLCLKMPVN